MDLVPTIHRDQVRRERLDLTCVTEPTSVHAPHSGDALGERLHHIRGRPIITQHEDIGLDGGDVRIKQKYRGHVVESGDNRARRQDRGGLLGGRSFNNCKGKCSLLVEAQGIDAVDHDGPGEVVAQRLQRRGVTIPRDRDDDDIALPRGRSVVRTSNSETHLRCDGGGTFSIAGSDGHALSGHGKSAREPATLLPRSTQHTHM